MFDAHPSFRFKHRRKEREFELEIGASFLRWLLIAIVILVCLAKETGPSKVCEILFDSVPTAESCGISRWPREMLGALRPASECSSRPTTKVSTRGLARSRPGKKKPAQSSCLRESPSDCSVQ